jgi:hypothetical protein
MAMPLALTDAQLDALHRLAFPLAPADRSAFLELVAQQLKEQGGNIGDGVLYRIAVECQRRFWSPPAIDGTTVRAGVGKYAR